MEKYIKSSDLAEVMGELAATALDYADKVIVETTTRKLVDDVTFTVVVRNANYAKLAEQEYYIVPATKSPDEVVNETIFNALEQIEAARRQAEEKTPSNNE